MSLRVLVVDDDFMVARVHRGLVERVPGFTVVGEAHTAAEALAAAERLAPDLVLLDVYLPDRSGLEVLRALRAQPGRSPDVLVVSASRDVEVLRAALQGGVVHYLIKPFTFPALRERLERYAAAHGRLATLGEARQDDVDSVLGALRGSAPARLPKGLSGPTAALVAGALRSAGELSAAEAAAHCGLSRVSARRYLEHLVRAGQAELRLRYGTSGRPEHRYRWVPGAAAGPTPGHAAGPARA